MSCTWPSTGQGTHGQSRGAVERVELRLGGKRNGGSRRVRLFCGVKGNIGENKSDDSGRLEQRTLQHGVGQEAHSRHHTRRQGLVRLRHGGGSCAPAPTAAFISAPPVDGMAHSQEHLLAPVAVAVVYGHFLLLLLPPPITLHRRCASAVAGSEQAGGGGGEGWGGHAGGCSEFDVAAGDNDAVERLRRCCCVGGYRRKRANCGWGRGREHLAR